MDTSPAVHYRKRSSLGNTTITKDVLLRWATASGVSSEEIESLPMEYLQAIYPDLFVYGPNFMEVTAFKSTLDRGVQLLSEMQQPHLKNRLTRAFSVYSSYLPQKALVSRRIITRRDVMNSTVSSSLVMLADAPLYQLEQKRAQNTYGWLNERASDSPLAKLKLNRVYDFGMSVRLTLSGLMAKSLIGHQVIVDGESYVFQEKDYINLTNSYEALRRVINSY
jgi:hypothetical protein